MIIDRNLSRRDTGESPLQRLDHYFADMLRCDQSVLRAGSWIELKGAFTEGNLLRMTGMRQIMFLFAPKYDPRVQEQPSGVVWLAPELRSPVLRLLKDADPQTLYGSPSHSSALSRIVRQQFSAALVPGSTSRLSVYYTTTYKPYTGPWQDWIGPLDCACENDPFALALRFTHSGAVFVARVRDSIVAYTGLRAYSQRVWELTLPRVTTSPMARAIVKKEELLTALLARATRATVEAGALPMCTAPICSAASHRILTNTGYQRYAFASVYATVNT
jgi:hypothetical protein